MSLEQIKNCKYITSVGMLKTLDELDIITYDKHPSNIRHDYSKLQNGYDGVCIYIKFSNVREFIYNVFPRIPYKFILITGDGDETMPNDMFDYDTFNRVINDERILHWYSVNCIEDIHPKFSLIPIGVNFHSLTYGEFCGWHHTSQTPEEQENMIEEIRNNNLSFDLRIPKCYSNFHFVTYSEFGNPRKEAMDKIPQDLVFYEPNLIPRFDTWNNQVKYSFVLSPMGHGMDCHRTWEALMLGCIVIVKKSVLDSLYKDLPVLIVNDWSEITQELLNETIEKFKNTEFNLEKITLKYWVDKIKSLS
jgi:hypothetical protein